jgi:hypothetical protein
MKLFFDKHNIQDVAANSRGGRSKKNEPQQDIKE